MNLILRYLSVIVQYLSILLSYLPVMGNRLSKVNGTSDHGVISEFSDVSSVMGQPPEIVRIRELCPRFRVLIIGRANSGKTTILKKMCNSTEEAIVRDENGRVIDNFILENPSALRGIHNINNEITFESNPNFVFHDSMGFEAGSAVELDKVKNFIAERAKKGNLKDRIHAIWNCIPMDQDRVLSEAELSLFQHGTGVVPVIVLFTKWDAQIIKAYGALLQQGKRRADATRDAPYQAKQVFEDHYLPVVSATRNPPAGYALLGYMDKPDTSCEELAEKTAGALDSSVLRKFFVSVQTHNIQLCMRAAIEKVVKKYYFGVLPSKERFDRFLWDILCWFPHILADNVVYSGTYGKKWAGWDYGNSTWGKTSRTVFLPKLAPIISLTERTPLPPDIGFLNATAATVVVAHRSFDLKNDRRDPLEAAINEFLVSPRCEHLKKAIKSRTWERPGAVLDGEDADMESRRVKRVTDDLMKICMDNLLG